jgi:hypothetical protein
MQSQVEVDEPASMTVPTLPENDHRSLGRDTPFTDTVVDAMTEEERLRGMGIRVPMHAHSRGRDGVEGQGG